MYVSALRRPLFRVIRVRITAAVQGDYISIRERTLLIWHEMCICSDLAAFRNPDGPGDGHIKAALRTGRTHYSTTYLQKQLMLVH